jgi:hypothetical protein
VISRRLSSLLPSSSVLFATAAMSCAVLAAPRAARADGAYGRLSGDVSLQGSVGATVGHGPAGSAMVSALYLVSVGPYAQTELALTDAGRFADRGNHRLRSVSTGVELRPLFLPRFLSALETGRSFRDLFLDSLGLHLGARFYPGSQQRAFEVGGVADIPLGDTFAGAFLGVAVTKVISEGSLRGQPIPGDDSVFFTVSLGVRGLLTTHLVDVNDRLDRSVPRPY